VSTEPRGSPSPQAKSLHLAWWYWLAMLLMTGLVIITWFERGPSDPTCALMVAGWTYGFVPAVCGPAERILRPHWFRVSTGERMLHRILGVEIFDWLLERFAYNRRIIRPARGFDGTKAGLRSLEQGLRASAGAHVACFAPHILLSTVALVTGHGWRSSLWILLPGVVIHVYPVLLQRSIMLRVQPLLDRSAS
jgi:hypothetical protein